MRYAAIGMLFGAAIAGCASSAPVPAGRLTASHAAIRAAEEVGAKGVPEASLHLALAKEQMEQARGLMAAGENERARLLLLRAEADAELALILTREHAAEVDARQALQQVQEIQQRLR